MTTVVILQPGYLPWLGFFDQLAQSDVFVYYDDVQFDKHGWRNRNRIKTTSGPSWLTVPVLHSGRPGQRLLDVEIDNRHSWSRKHVSAIAQSYARAPHLKRYLGDVEAFFATPWKLLIDLDIAAVALLCKWLGLTPRTVRASQLGIAGGQTERLVSICRHFSATRYLTGDAARDYLDERLFVQAGIALDWHGYEHPTYPQLHGPFIPSMSVVDLIMNVGPGSFDVLRSTK